MIKRRCVDVIRRLRIRLKVEGNIIVVLHDHMDRRDGLTKII